MYNQRKSFLTEDESSSDVHPRSSTPPLVLVPRVATFFVEVEIAGEDQRNFLNGKGKF